MGGKQSTQMQLLCQAFFTVCKLGCPIFVLYAKHLIKKCFRPFKRAKLRNLHFFLFQMENSLISVLLPLARHTRQRERVWRDMIKLRLPTWNQRPIIWAAIDERRLYDETHKPKAPPHNFFFLFLFFFCLFVIVLIDYNCTDTHLWICHATSHRFSGGCAVGSGRKSAGCGRVARRITGVDDGGCCGRSRSRSRSDDGFAVVTATAIATATATRRWMVMMVDAFLTVRRVHHVVSINDSSGQHTHTHTHTNTTRV